MTTSTLLPCPFCGSEPVKLETRESDGFIHGYTIRCDHCAVEIADEYENEATENWNRRVSQSPASQGAPDKALYDTRPHIAAVEYGPEPSLRQVVGLYYSARIDDPELAKGYAAQYFAALGASQGAVPEGLRSMKDAPRNGTPILLHTTKHGFVEAWFSPGEWSEETPVSPREYTGSAWVCADDAFQIEVEELPDGEYHDGTADGWMPLPPASVPAPTVKAEEVRHDLATAQDEAARHLRVLDGVAALIGLPHDEELSVVAVERALEHAKLTAPTVDTSCLQCGGTGTILDETTREHQVACPACTIRAALQPSDRHSVDGEAIRRAALEEAISLLSCLLPPVAGQPADKFDRLVDEIRRNDIETIRSLIASPMQAPACCARHCSDETDCSNVALCRAVEDVYAASPKGEETAVTATTEYQPTTARELLELIADHVGMSWLEFVDGEKYDLSEVKAALAQHNAEFDATDADWKSAKAERDTLRQQQEDQGKILDWLAARLLPAQALDLAELRANLAPSPSSQAEG